MTRDRAGRRRRTSAGVRLGDALEQALKHLGRDQPFRRQRALDVWAEAVGPTVASHSRAVGWRGDRLVVEVDDPTWAQQLMLMQEALRAAVNRRLDGITVGGLYFRVSGGRGETAPKRPGRGPAPGRVPGASPVRTPAEPPDPQALPLPYRRWLDRAADCGDPELAAAMSRWLLRQLARRSGTAAGEGLGACPSCGAVVLRPAGRPVTDPCPACSAEWRPGGLRDRARALLEEEPWLPAAAVAERLPGVGARIYADVRGKLLHGWQAEFQALLERLGRRGRARDRAGLRRRARVLALRLTCLITGLPPQDVSDAAVLQALGPGAEELLGDG